MRNPSRNQSGGEPRGRLSARPAARTAGSLSPPWGDVGDLDAPVRLTTQQSEAEKHYADLLQRYGQPVGHLLMRRE
jgi:hypothetical protein